MPELLATAISTLSNNANILMNKYRIVGKKGEGTFSEVLKCQSIKDGSYWACKKMKQHYDSAEQVNNLREIQALRRLSPHANILELHEVLFEKKTGILVLVCELMDMNIYEFIRERQTYPHLSQIKSYIHQLCKSIDHIHRNGIFHRDVKPENILIKDDLLKLADFGSCRSVYSKQPYTEYISTRWYRAPECLLTDGYYTYKMDVWSVGCVFYEILTLRPLFPGSNEVDQIAKIHDVMGTPGPFILEKLRNKTRGMNFNFPPKKGSGIDKVLPHASSDCVQLIYSMCTYDPDERISAKQALKHPYFKEFRDADRRGVILPRTSMEHLHRQEGRAEEGQAGEGQAGEGNIEEGQTQEGTPPTDKVKPMVPEKASDRPGREAAPPGEAGRPESRPEGGGVTSRERSTSPGRRAERPGSGASGTSAARYPASTLHRRDPLYTHHRRDKRRRRKLRMTEPGALGVTAGLLPKVPPHSQSLPVKSLGYQATFPFGPGTLPKIGGATTTATTSAFLPTLGQPFVKPSKAKPMQAGAGQATKRVFGRYQLPSIDRRGGGH